MPSPVTSTPTPRPDKATVAVFMAEVFKLPFCIAMTAWSCGGPTRVWAVLRTEICEMWADALKCLAPHPNPNPNPDPTPNPNPNANRGGGGRWLREARSPLEIPG